MEEERQPEGKHENKILEFWTKLPIWGKIGLGAGVAVLSFLIYKQQNQQASTPLSTGNYGTTQPTNYPGEGDTYPPAGAPPPPPPGGSNPAPPPPNPTITYTIVSGDTLWKIAQLYHTTVAALYQKNQQVIEAAAKSHGHANSNNGNLIFPGTTLTIS